MQLIHPDRKTIPFHIKVWNNTSLLFCGRVLDGSPELTQNPRKSGYTCTSSIKSLKKV